MTVLNTQRGNIALVMVIVLMTMALFLLKTLQFYQESARDEFLREKQYFEAFNQAESALSWGLTQSWQMDLTQVRLWECQQHQNQPWESCLKYYKEGNFIMLGRSFYADKQYINVYRWVTPVSGSRKVKARVHGWLDYCPIKKNGFC